MDQNVKNFFLQRMNQQLPYTRDIKHKDNESATDIKHKDNESATIHEDKFWDRIKRSMAGLYNHRQKNQWDYI